MARPSAYNAYVLVHSEHALAHRRTIIEAAEMGDFWGWGDEPAQRVFQGITRLMSSGQEAKAVYAEAFLRIPSLIDGSDPEVPEIEASLKPLRRGVELVEQGRIVRFLIEDRLALYLVPLAMADNSDIRASYVAGFNEQISEKAILWPQVRARWDAERVCLVSTDRKGGWFHDLYFPGYLWADTESKWLVPGMQYHDGMASYDLDNPRLVAAFEGLQRQETAPGRWGLGGTTLPFGKELQDQFPLVGRFLTERGHAAISNLSPDQVAKEFEGVFD